MKKPILSKAVIFVLLTLQRFGFSWLIQAKKLNNINGKKRCQHSWIKTERNQPETALKFVGRFFD